MEQEIKWGLREKGQDKAQRLNTKINFSNNLLFLDLRDGFVALVSKQKQRVGIYKYIYI